MSELSVNPNRMELRKIRSKLKTAEKGYSLLKDKTNELIRYFYANVRENKKIRQEVEAELISVLKQFERAKMKLSDAGIQLLFSLPSHAYDVNFDKTSLFNTEVPIIQLEEKVLDENMPYSPIGMSYSLDIAVKNFYQIFPKLIKLAEVEKTTVLLANEIERNKRRVNALENILLPKYKRAIQKIELKLAENEISNTAKLMKIKTLIGDKKK